MPHFKATALLKQITIYNSIPENCLVFVDTDCIQLIIRNLLSNAVKFTNVNGSIWLTAKPINENTMCVSVKNTGKGMSQEAIGKIFSNDGFTTRGTASEKGSGLGLKLCKDFVEKNGGSLKIESEPDIITNIQVFLPIPQNK